MKRHHIRSRSQVIIGLGLLILIAAGIQAGAYGDHQPGLAAPVGKGAGGTASLGLANSQVPLPRDDVRFVAVDIDGSTWFRVRRGPGQEDRVARLTDAQALEWYDNLRTAVRLGYERILRHGSLPDFWAVDERDNVWVGTSYYNGQAWLELVESDDGVSIRTEYEDRTVIDRNGRAWVPYRTVHDCLAAEPCVRYGMAAFDLRGDILQDLAVEYPVELAAIDLPWIEFEQTGFELLAVSPTTAYKLPSLDARVFPELAIDPDTGRRSAGFASASAVMPNGQLAVYLWLDANAEQPDRKIKELQWTGVEWQSSELTRGPIFAKDSVFVTAAAYDRAGALWLASSEAEVAAWKDGAWSHHFTPANSPLGGGIHDMEVGLDGRLWLGTNDGVRAYDPTTGLWETSELLFLPYLGANHVP